MGISPEVVKIKEILDRAVELQKNKDIRGARVNYLRALDMHINCAAAWSNLSVLAVIEHNYDAAVAMATRAVILEPSAGACRNLGRALWFQRVNYDAALNALLEAVKMAPDDFNNHYNLGLVYYARREPEKAVASLREALRLNPDHLESKCDLALAILQTGDLVEGLKAHEVRWDYLDQFPIWRSGLPYWGPDYLPEEDSTIIVHAEQGMGDTVQFVRFIPQMRERFKPEKVFLLCQKPLIPLLERNKDTLGIDVVMDVMSDGDTAMTAQRGDCHVPLMSLVSRLDIGYEDLPAPKPYLKAPSLPNPINLLTPGTVLTIGLCWAPNAGYESGRIRSVHLDQLLPLGSLPGVRLFSLQYGESQKDIDTRGASALVTDLVPLIHDVSDTACFIEQLDMIISVDTMVAHLAGAMGKPVLMLNPYTACWRWKKGAEPWYSTMKLFDQDRPMIWGKALDRLFAHIHAELQRRIREQAAEAA